MNPWSSDGSTESLLNRIIPILGWSKSYMFAYREIGIFHEHVVNKVMEDFIRDCQPRKVNIVGDFNIRGGIKTVVRANYEQPTVESE